MKKETSLYKSTYRTNPETGKYIIDIGLDYYLEFFHEWDNTSFKKRDVHPELAEFIDLCAEDIPIKKGIEIHFCIAKESKDEKKEKLVRESYQHYYEFLERVEKKKIRRNYTNAALLALIGLGLILANAILVKQLPDHLWSEVALKGLYIGGYVFFWESLYNVSFGSKELIDKKMDIARLRKATLFFKYKEC